jgi:hypothetical protein
MRPCGTADNLHVVGASLLPSVHDSQTARMHRVATSYAMQILLAGTGD